jgi:hypothetical protein
MATRRGSISAAELLAKLNADPEWVRRTADRQAEVAAAEAQLRAEEQPLVDDLRRAGVAVSSAWDLVNSTSSYPAAVPVLLDHLHRSYHPKNREGIARALTVKEARGIAGGQVLAALRKETDSEVRWTLANALTIVATEAHADEIAALLGSRQYEDVRERLDRALKAARTRRAR